MYRRFLQNENGIQNENLLIVGAGIYGMVAAEIAVDMRCFKKIDFVDDEKKVAGNGKEIVGTTEQLVELSGQYDNIIVAIGNPEKRLALLKKIEQETTYRIVTLVSPKAYVSPSAQIGKGCVVEPMAVVHTNCVIKEGSIISAGAVVNHLSTCCEGVHIDCNGTVEGYCVVPRLVKVCSGRVYKREDSFKNADSSLDCKGCSKNPPECRTKENSCLEYIFEHGM